MKILLTGASSYVGARLYFDLIKNFNVVGTYNGNKLSKDFIKLNVASPNEVEQLISKLKPEIIIHAAANANARWCEKNPELALALNQESTKHIVVSANKINAKVFLVSSFAAKEPVNIYSKTKAESEKLVRKTKSGFIILRPSLIIGFSPNTVNDRPFNRLLKNLDQGTPAVYDTSWRFQPTYVGHISEIIVSIINRNIINEAIPIAVPGLKSRYDIAKDILGAFGIKVTPINNHDLTPVITDNLKVLERLKLPKYSYQDIVEKCIEEIKNRESFSFVS